MPRRAVVTTGPIGEKDVKQGLVAANVMRGTIPTRRRLSSKP